MFWGQRSNWSHLESHESKGHFRQKRYNLFMLHSMAMELIHVQKFEILYLLRGVKGQLGVIWGHMGQKVCLEKVL